MRRVLPLAVVLCSLCALGASPPPRPVTEEDKGAGFADIGVAARGIFVPGGDGTVRRLDGDALPVVFDAGRKLVSIAVSEDGQQLAMVGAGVVVRSSDGGRSFQREPTPDGVMAYAIAFSRSELFLFDVKGRGFRSSRPGAAFQPIELPRATRYWTASFSGLRGYVVGEKGVLLATEDGGRSWKLLTAPASDAEAVLAVGQTVWVSGQEGVFRSDDGGQKFRQVFASQGSCYRMGARGRAVVVACAPMDHVLAWSADGEHFQEILVQDAANMMSAVITSDGKIVAVGANDLMVLATPQSGRIVATSKIAQRWLDLIRSSRAQERERALRSEKPREPELPEGVLWRSGERQVLTGTVRNARGAPMAGVIVEMEGSGPAQGKGFQKVKTGADGRYRFEPSQVGTVRVSVRVPGYSPGTREAPLCPWGETVVDIPLKAQEPSPGAR